MKIGGIIQDGRLTHDISSQILQLVKKNPNYQIVVLVGENVHADICYWTFASDVKVEIIEILDCKTPWWDRNTVCTDRKIFESFCANNAHYVLYGMLKREPTKKELSAELERIKEEHEPYWKKCIAIKVDN